MKNVLTAAILLFSIHSFAQSNWKMQYVREGDQMVNVKNRPSAFVIAIKEKKISGSFGCNTFTGHLEYTKGDKVKPIKAIKIKAKCPQDLDKSEYAALEALNVADKLVINQDLAKFYSGDRLVLELKR